MIGLAIPSSEDREEDARTTSSQKSLPPVCLRGSLMSKSGAEKDAFGREPRRLLSATKSGNAGFNSGSAASETLSVEEIDIRAEENDDVGVGNELIVIGYGDMPPWKKRGAAKEGRRIEGVELSKGIGDHRDTRGEGIIGLGHRQSYH